MGQTRELLNVFILLVVTGRALSASLGGDGNGEDEEVTDNWKKRNLLNSRADVVFLLDRSGSVGAANFEIMKGFVESLLTNVVVDANATRVAVITYSNQPVLHLNYILHPKTKCSLSEELQDIVYKDSEATNIAAALEEARNVLLDSRPNVNKVVIMISDGLATLGGSPVPAATRLKEDTKARIFAFGIGKFLKQELQAIATSPKHVDSCRGFKEFKRLARKIRGDPHESSWSAESETPNCDHLCNSPYIGEPNDPGCCDHHARCSCALRSGVYGCVCGPGYFGMRGTWGDCRACPKGTFKSRLVPSDSCTYCPYGSTTEAEGSTSIKDCHCKEGYEGSPSNGEPCKPVTCPILQDPTNGRMIWGRCDNHFGSHCAFACDEGYEFEDPKSSMLVCQSDGQWSASIPICRRAHCRSPSPLLFGKVYCDSYTDFTVGKKCHYSCHKGFILHGSKVRECLPNKHWSGTQPQCIVLQCHAPLPLKNGRIHNCAHNKKPQFGDTCVFTCDYGYSLVGPQTFQCDVSGKLVDPYEQRRYTENLPYCKDVTPPEITCPKDITVKTEKGQNYANVMWRRPEVDDNGVEGILVTVDPPGLFSRGKFTIGTSKITYKATDVSGLHSECTFTVTVIDKEPPQVLSCPNDIEVNATEEDVKVEWQKPEFKDNSGKYSIIKQNYKSGDAFKSGSHNVFQAVKDPSGNVALCEFTVTVTEYYCPYYPPPINGALACEDWMYGQYCQIYCNEEYDFVTRPAEWYVCNDRKWETLPEGYSLPWPDCTTKAFPYQVRKMLNAYYYNGNCNDPEVQNAIRLLFLRLFIKTFGHQHCVSEGACTLELVKVSCGKIIKQGLRVKRDAWLEADEEKLEIELDITIHPNEKFELTEEKVLEFLNSIDNIDWDIEDEFNELIVTLDEEALIGNSSYRGPVLKMESEETVLLCQPGSELKDKECMLCPLGTYHNLTTDKCLPCDTGRYQEHEGQTECLPCPPGTSTRQLHSTSLDDCKAICKEGTFSATGLETCTACPVGTYQNKTGQMNCEPCSTGLTTATEASVDSTNCQASCSPGYYSDTGIEPCRPCPIGYYQGKHSQRNCEECPGNLTTISDGETSSTACINFNPCENSSVCNNGGSCFMSGKEAACKCGPSYSGEHCELDIDECEDDPCFNNGECINTDGSFYCNCSTGYQGHLCEVKVTPCTSGPCLNNATSCIEMDEEDYMCICAYGYGGKNCDEIIEQCGEDLICKNGGICIMGENETNDICECPDGLTGADCSVDVDECNNITCQNGGTCVDELGAFHCMCRKGFTGLLCETDIDECENNECYNGSTCMDDVGGYLCLCPPGWSGNKCENRLSSDFVLSFPENSSLANTATLHLKSPLSEATVSVWVQTNDVQHHDMSATPLSYAAVSLNEKDSAVTLDNALTISDCSDVTVYVNNEPVITDINIADGNWHHFAFTWSSDSGEWKAYKDGDLKSNGTGFQKGAQIPSGGPLILGQEQDEIGGGFSPLQTFTGNITRLNIWNSFFSHEDIKQLCQMSEEEKLGKVMAWPDVLSGITGDVRVLSDRNPVPPSIASVQ